MEFKRPPRPPVPFLDIKRLWKDLGGSRALSDRMCAAGLRDFWELKTVQARRHRQDMYFGRLLEIIHVHRLQGRTIRLEDYVIWPKDTQYPAPSASEIPQPVPVSQRES
jgi:hypothetical protein